MLIDIRTRKTLKTASGLETDSDGFLGHILMLLEPSLERLNPDDTSVELRKAVCLVDINQVSNKRKRGTPGRPKTVSVA